jgi:hypothetical protein
MYAREAHTTRALSLLWMAQKCAYTWLGKHASRTILFVPLHSGQRVAVSVGVFSGGDNDSSPKIQKCILTSGN